MITFVLGGVRSGKSRLAQNLASRYGDVLFIATARRSDEEMCFKIERHRADRPPSWRTIEEPVDIAGILTAHPACDFIILDCLTLWASNLLCGESEQRWERAERFYQALRALEQPIAIVSNEVGSGIVPAFALGRQYRDFLGEVNQRVAALADNVVLTIAGIPLVLKGTLI